MGPSGPMSKGGWRGWRGGNNYDHADCFEHVQGASFVFFLWKKWIFWGPHYGDVPYYKGFQKIPRKFALKNRKMPVFPLDFYTIFSILYHFDTVLGGFMGSGGGGGGGGGDSLHAHGTLWRSFFLSNQAGVESRAKSVVSGCFEPRFRGF